MPQTWTFGRQIAVGLAITALLSVLVGGVAIYALSSVVDAKDRVIRDHAEVLVDAQRLRTAVEQRGGAFRGFLLAPGQRFADSIARANAEIATIVARLRAAASTAEERARIDEIETASARWESSADRLIARRRAGEDVGVIAEAFESETLPLRDALSGRIDAYVELEERRLEGARNGATEAASLASRVVGAVVLGILLLSLALALVLTRSLTRQIGTAVGRIQSSSTELQAAANQQATGSKEQATAMREISTTITELLATSRQIAESAQRVAQIAGQTVSGAKEGDATVQRSAEAISAIRRQVDVVVSHMLELGRKSQQIGAVVDIVAELAEQTNILAINATIEAAGAGEAGKRFAVVADEIRKLADRVAGSAKEIRSLVDDVRSSVNSTVMATETSSKTVDAGAQQFGQVSTTFRRIADMVATTTDAAREIELSTKQQSTAVEQVNVAISNVAQATRETEASAGQTLSTSSELTGLSRELLRMVEPEAAARA